MIKKGDTLIEVTLAVGIFSMIAIAIVSVMSGGTSSAQTALETTLAREEIDTQAEALRFIQASYISDKNSANKRFVNLWQAITKDAIDLNSLGLDDAAKSNILQFAPAACSDLYDKNGTSNIFSQKAFILNTRKLGTFTADASNTDNGIPSVYVSATKQGDKFYHATTYPRLVYTNNGSSTANINNPTELLENASASELFRAEGIYVIAIKDADSTKIVGDAEAASASAFYDFYIRTCWYGSGSEQASTISTVIRLYDPDAAAVVPETPETPGD